jgi:predicted outer membrane repeat protein
MKKKRRTFSRQRKLQLEHLEDRRVLATLTVTSDSDVTGDDGVLTLREAIAAANLNDEADTIVFDSSLSGQTISLSEGELQITSELTIDAGDLANRIVIDASGNDPTPDVDDGMGSRVLRIDDGSDNAVTVTLASLYLTGGDVDESGGAIWSSESLDLQDVQLVGNHALLDGGGLYLQPDGDDPLPFEGLVSLDVQQLEVSNNRAGRNGGGIVTDKNAFFNIATNISIVGNEASNNGGGIYSVGSIQAIRDAQISDNRAVNGGGFYYVADTQEHRFASFSFSTSTFSFNNASENGGGVYVELTGDSLPESYIGLSLNRSTISQNFAGVHGGGIYAGLTMDAVLELSAVTIAQNVANASLEGGAGGGVYVADGDLPEIERTVVGDNMRLISSDNETLDDDLFGDLTARYSLIEATSLGTTITGVGNLTGIDPDLENLADNGGETLTHLPRVTSPLVDAGTPCDDDPDAFCPSDGAVDQRGEPRIVDGNGNGEARVDIGSVELQGNANAAPVANAGPDRQAPLNDSIQLDATSSFDPDDGPESLTYQWSVLTASSSTAAGMFDDANSATPNFTATEIGTYQLELMVSDGAATATDLMLVEVFINEAPFAIVDVDTLTVGLNRSIRLDGSRSFDAEQSDLSYAWTVVDAPEESSFSFTDETAAMTDFETDMPGDYTVQLVVNDQFESSAPFQLTVSVLGNGSAAGGPYIALRGQAVQLKGQIDTTSNETTYAWDLDQDGNFDDAVGATPTISASELEAVLGPNASGAFPITLQTTTPSEVTTFDTFLTIESWGQANRLFSVGAHGVFGDIDGDGDVDAIGREPGTLGSVNLTAFINDGLGNFSVRDVAAGERLQNSNASALIDFDRDGDLDLIMTPGRKPTTVLLNDGQGHFTSTFEFQDANEIYGTVALVEFPFGNPNAPEFLVADTDSVVQYSTAVSFNEQEIVAQQRFFENDPVTAAPLGEIRDVLFADFDANGHVDALIERTTGSMEMWLNDGQGDFNRLATDLSLFPSLETLQTADVDADGDLDFVSQEGRVFLQDGSRRFFDAGIDINGNGDIFQTHQLADLNGDGHIDIVSVDGTGSTASIDFNDGLGTFTNNIQFPVKTGNSIVNLAIEDFDGNGQVDILVNRIQPSVFSAPISTTIFGNGRETDWHNASSPADVDRNGVVSPLDPLLIINELNEHRYSTPREGLLAQPPAMAPALFDVNADQFVSPIDVIQALNAIISTGDPTFATLADVNLLGGSPLMVPLNTNAFSNAKFTVSSSDASLVEATVLTGNRSLRMDISSPGNNIEGEMIFELFDNYVPRVTNRIAELADQGFYDGLIFHRVIDSFVIQGGDPTGNGAGGSSLPDFDDQYHPDLQHNRTGLLSMAKSFDDTNNSQFFVTEGPTRFLDFNHSIFGLLVDGEATREAISNVATNVPDRPNSPVTIEQMEVFTDNRNGVLVLKAPEGASGTATITITAAFGGQALSQSFDVTITADIENSQPYLLDIPNLSVASNSTLTYQLEAIDVEGDAVLFLDPDEAMENSRGFPVQLPPPGLNVSIDGNGLMTIEATNDLVGTFEFTVGAAAPDLETVNDWQTLSITVFG